MEQDHPNNSSYSSFQEVFRSLSEGLSKSLSPELSEQVFSDSQRSRFPKNDSDNDQVSADESSQTGPGEFFVEIVGIGFRETLVEGEPDKNSRSDKQVE